MCGLVVALGLVTVVSVVGGLVAAWLGGATWGVIVAVGPATVILLATVVVAVLDRRSAR